MVNSTPTQRGCVHVAAYRVARADRAGRCLCRDDHGDQRTRAFLYVCRQQPIDPPTTSPQTGPEQKAAEQWLCQEEARNPREKWRAARAPHLLVVVSAWCCSPDTVHATDMSDNDQCVRHTKSAGNHRTRGAAPGDTAGGWQGNAGFHLAAA